MKNYRYPLATTSWDESEYTAIQRVVSSGVFSMGDEVKAFEKAFTKYICSDYTVMVNSGSSANLLMVAALFYVKENPIKRGDEVIVPAISWSTTYFPLYQYGLKLKFVDIDMKTLNYDLEKLEEAVTDQTRLIMTVNLLGNPNDFSRMKKLTAAHDVRIIEDNCESMGAEYEGRKAGTFGVMGSFSSFFSHHISTMEGGMIVTDDEEIYHILLSLRAHGWTRDLPKTNQVCGQKSTDAFIESFRFVLPGYNVRPLELSAAIGIEQLNKLPTIISNRRKNGDIFQKAFVDHPDLLIQKEIGKSSWFGFSFVVRPGSNLSRKELIERLERLGFECRPIVAGNFVKNDVIQFFDYEISGDLTAASYVDQNGLFIGNHHYPLMHAVDDLFQI